MISIPAPLNSLLQLLGHQFPSGNEDQIVEYARQWQQYGGEVTALVREAGAAAGYARATNDGPAMQAFSGNWSALDGVEVVATKLGVAGNVVAACLMMIAGVTTGLKVTEITNVSVLQAHIASAQAAAPATFGASLSTIAPAQQITRQIIDQAIRIAAESLRG
ncbi:hypothetical protein [Enemella sp. A6]|uniref:WXG100-like domain-containing protein n=1 Tax=Enemella sp. A6 TaxID=3440152 RepID=UPI003EB6B37A